MDTEQARAILTALDARDQAVANLRNAAAMSKDDARAEQMLQEAGDSYALAVNRLDSEDLRAVAALGREGLAEVATLPGGGDVDETGLRSVPPEGDVAFDGKGEFKPDTVVGIARDGRGEGTVQPRGKINAGSTIVKLRTDAHFRGQDFAAGDQIAVATDCLTALVTGDGAESREGGQSGAGEGGGAGGGDGS